MRIEWPGIPTQFWPDTETPWRVVWGLGAFKDFATLDAAELYAEELRESLTGDWVQTVRAPFNAVEREVS